MKRTRDYPSLKAKIKAVRLAPSGTKRGQLLGLQRLRTATLNAENAAKSELGLSPMVEA